jgi:hypothetical protein
MNKPLGRRLPTDFDHMDKYPMLMSAMPSKPVPVPIGVNWYSDFDTPKLKNDKWWIGLDHKKLGSIRGGHCVCLKPPSLTDPASWWHFYDQGSEGACVGFGESRMMSLMNRKRYDARWLYHQAQLSDEYPDTPPAEGTSVRAGCDILRKLGHATIGRNGLPGPPSLAEGIKVNRWAKSVDEVLQALGIPGWKSVPILNSWGSIYPHIVNMPLETLGRLLNEDGEMAIVTDR